MPKLPPKECQTYPEKRDALRSLVESMHAELSPEDSSFFTVDALWMIFDTEMTLAVLEDLSLSQEETLSRIYQYWSWLF